MFDQNKLIQIGFYKCVFIFVFIIVTLYYGNIIGWLELIYALTGMLREVELDQVVDHKLSQGRFQQV